MNATTTPTCTLQEALDYLWEQTQKGHFFAVRFIKRTDGSVREMHARTGVRKHLKGEGPKYDFYAKKLLPCFDLVKKEYRVVALDALTHVKMNGEWHEVVAGPVKVDVMPETPKPE